MISYNKGYNINSIYEMEDEDINAFDSDSDIEDDEEEFDDLGLLSLGIITGFLDDF